MTGRSKRRVLSESPHGGGAVGLLAVLHWLPTVSDTPPHPLAPRVPSPPSGPLFSTAGPVNPRSATPYQISADHINYMQGHAGYDLYFSILYMKWKNKGQTGCPWILFRSRPIIIKLLCRMSLLIILYYKIICSRVRK